MFFQEPPSLPNTYRSDAVLREHLSRLLPAEFLAEVEPEIDRIEVSRAWTELHAVQARAGLCALPYEDRHGRHDRVVQHALLHLYGPSSAVYSCPVAMTDAAVRVLVDHAPAELRERVVPRLTSRDPERAWTSGQWMT